MTIEQAQEITRRDRELWDPYEALMNPDYMPEYTAACNFEAAWWETHGTRKRDGRIFRKKHCTRCGGSGILPCYDHIDRGRCWNCGGTGYIEVYE